MGGICSAAVGKLVASTMNFSPASTSYNALQASFVGIGQLCGFPCVIPLVRMEFKCYWLVSFSSRVPLGARGGTYFRECVPCAPFWPQRATAVGYALGCGSLHGRSGKLHKTARVEPLPMQKTAFPRHFPPISGRTVRVRASR